MIICQNLHLSLSFFSVSLLRCCMTQRAAKLVLQTRPAQSNCCPSTVAECKIFWDSSSCRHSEGKSHEHPLLHSFISLIIVIIVRQGKLAQAFWIKKNISIHLIYYRSGFWKDIFSFFSGIFTILNLMPF